MTELEKKPAAGKWADKSRAARSKVVTVSQEQLVEAGHLRPDQPLPLVLRPNVAGLDVCAWARSNREYIEAELLKHGAILFRGFDLSSSADFENFVDALAIPLILRARGRGKVLEQIAGDSD